MQRLFLLLYYRIRKKAPSVQLETNKAKKTLKYDRNCKKNVGETNQETRRIYWLMQIYEYGNID